MSLPKLSNLFDKEPIFKVLRSDFSGLVKPLMSLQKFFEQTGSFSIRISRFFCMLTGAFGLDSKISIRSYRPSTLIFLLP